MKTLTILRHGKSSWDDPARSDFERPLNPRGIRSSRLIGEKMRIRGLRFDRVLASPARRVVETLDQVEKGYRGSLRASFHDEIYEASWQTLLRMLQTIAREAENVLMVGHNPGLQQLACALARPSDPQGVAIAAHYPTAALILMQLPAADWHEVQPGTGRVVDYMKPRDIEEQRSGGQD